MNFEGRLLGNRYEIIERIGIGGMATVYKAKCHVLNRYVAVKILRDEFTTDREFIRRFNTEAQAAARLTHPNIVSIYDVGNEGNIYYIVMELIQGKTLKEIIEEDGALPWKWSINIAIQIASALEMAHRNNIIHRDIKPHNIIITEDGVAKVTDFGIAKAVSNSTITAFGTTIGSVHYFSPEHARGGFTDAKSDLYSLGVVLYEMLTGRVPFDADTPVSVALKHMQEIPIEPLKINPLIPSSLNNIILKAMQKDPNQRYQSATEMLRDLRQVAKNPEGNFVVLNKYSNDFPTQKVETIQNRTLNEKAGDIKEKQENKKKQNKLVAFYSKHKVLKVFSIILLCILIFVVAMGITIAVANANRPKQVQIPNLVGKTLNEVEELTKQANVKYEVTEETFSKDVAEGLVISQDPRFAENYEILENSTIKIIVSKGIELTKVPKVAGKQKDEAIAEIEKQGLKAEIKEETSDKVEEGYVISQEPKEDEEIAKDSVVIITVSTGRGIEEVDVPNVIGKTEDEAKKMITDAKLVANVRYEEDTTKSNGVVLKQDKDANSKLDEGSTLTITVNKLPEIKNATVTVNVKSLTGYSETTNIENSTNVVSTEPKDVNVKVIIVSQGNSKEYEKRTKENNKNLSFDVSGVGTVKVSVKINDAIVVDEQYWDLNVETSKSFE